MTHPDGKSMMEPNITSLSKCLAIFALCIPATLYAEVHHRYECPSPLSEGKVRLVLEHVDVFDGPPENLASLIPAPAHNADIWDGLGKVDTYLVCGYKGTHKIVTLHAKGTTVCKVTDHPSRAFCD